MEPIRGVVGQDDALEALRFGLEISAPGQNVFVRGLVGTGRSTLIRHLLNEIRPACRPANDLCYVHNFAEPSRPKLLELPRGRGAAFRDRVGELADFIRDKLNPALTSDEIRARQSALEKELQREVKELGSGFEAELGRAGLTLVTVQLGPVTRPAVFPVVDGKPLPPDELERLVAAGEIDADGAQRLRDRVADFADRLEALTRRIHEAQEAHRARVRALYETETRRILQDPVGEIERGFPSEPVRAFLAAVIEDVIRTRLHDADEEDTLRRYRANLLLDHPPDGPCPTVVENTPTLRNLLGAIDRRVGAQGAVWSDHLMITAGSLLRANGGYLILDAREVLAEPAAWKAVVRTLRTGVLEIAPLESFWFGTGGHLQPEPIALQLKVILVGDAELYYLLDTFDHDFPHLFKVLADFDATIPRDADGLRYYAGVLARIARDEQLPPFERGAVAALAEHGARIAARRGRLSARFGRLADLAREAAFLARQRGPGPVSADDIRLAVRRTKRRADLPSRKFRELIHDGTIRIQTQGAEVGQVNGLAVTRSGQLTYGFPARITATIGSGSAGTINIEREAMLSGAIHTKGFYILGGLLRRLLRTRHPLAFSASIAFEQSYGGIDGDSASAAEICCLLSALTGVPLRQDVAMTGAIDQLGHVQAVGAVTEKIEGFYEACQDLGPTDTQGVLVPRANVGDLMLREDVVEACAAGRFQVWGVETIHEALAILTGRVVGAPDAAGAYPPDTLLGIAVAQARQYWELASARPGLAAPMSPDVAGAAERAGGDGEDDATERGR